MALAIVLGFATEGTSAEVAVALPLLPPLASRYPGQFDVNGCALIEHGDAPPTRICPAPAGESDGTLPSAEERGGDGWTRFLGYHGPYFARSVHDTGVTVLRDTVTERSEGGWGAIGLVRNDAQSVVTDVMVFVDLLGVDRRRLAVGQALVPVRNLRPGEPAPFQVHSHIRPEDVAEVAWRTSCDVAEPGAQASRMTEIVLARVVPAGNVVRNKPRVSGSRDESDPTPGPTEVGWGTLRHWGTEPIDRPSVVGLWIDERGRAVRLVSGRVARSIGPSAPTRARLEPGQATPFLLFDRDLDPSRPPQAGRWRLAVWQTAF